MERDENGQGITAVNLCKRCSVAFLTLVDEKHDECPDCMIYRVIYYEDILDILLETLKSRQESTQSDHEIKTIEDLIYLTKLKIEEVD